MYQQVGVANPQSEMDIIDVVTQVTGLTSGVTSICAGEQHSCAVHNGAAKCWGSSLLGQLGDPSRGGTVVHLPIQVQGLASGVVQIACGDVHTCAMLADGTARCWGFGFGGVIGDGVVEDSIRAAPAVVTGLSTVDRIAAGGYSSCAVANSDNETYCWGVDDYGGFGFGASFDPMNIQTYYSPIRMPNDFSSFGTITDISNGASVNCAIAGGASYCLGRNRDGTVGDNTDVDKTVPTQVVTLPPSPGVSISTRGKVSCVVLADGKLFCWGDAVAIEGTTHIGTLGDLAQTPQSNSAVQVVGPDDYKQVSVGVTLICTLRGTASEVWCWGDNSMGQMAYGNGSDVDSPFPVPISLP